MKISSVLRSAAVALVSVAAVFLVACGYQPYYQTSYRFAGRPTPPSQLLQRIAVTVTGNSIAGSGGSLILLDALRDIRFSVYNVNQTYSVTGFSITQAARIFNYPEQLTGYVLSNASNDITAIDWGKEQTSGTTASLGAHVSDVFVPQDGAYVLAALEVSGVVSVVDRTAQTTAGGNGVNYPLALPGAYRVAMNPSHTVMLAMARNSNLLYRVIRLNTNQAPPANAVSCLPASLPLFCMVPVPGTYDRPYTAYFSTDGATVYLLNCGPECGGAASSVSTLNVGALRIDNYDTTISPVTGSNIATPGGATVALQDGNTLYVAGQQVSTVPNPCTSCSVMGGRLTSINLLTRAASAPVSISDGTHTKLLLADDNTLWIGSQNCASGERKLLNINYNCLTRYDRTAGTAAVVPAVNPATVGATVPYPNTNGDPYYYGSLTGLAWVQYYGKVYTAYGGQVHAFRTSDGSEINNYNISVQGTALDVAYPDATTNLAN